MMPPTKKVAFALDRTRTDEFDDHGTSLFPIDRLPSEILLHIFRCCMPNDTPSYNCRKAPLLLCHVCSTWRHLVSDMSELWYALRLTVRFKALDNGGLGRRYAWAQNNWFSNTKNLPFLDLELYLSLSHYTANTPAAADLIGQVLLNRLDRYRSLDVGAHNASDLAPFFSHETQLLPHLETIVIRVPHFEVVGNITVFCSAPALRQVGLESLPSTLGQALPWAQLTHVTVMELLVHERWLGLLRECVNLQCGVFSVFLNRNYFPRRTIPAPLQLSGLGKLSLTVVDETHGAGPFPNWLTFPALQILDLRVLPPYRQSGVPFTVSPHLRQQLTTLTQLILENPDIPTSELLAFLRVLPCLRALEIIISDHPHQLSFDHNMLYEGLNPSMSSGNEPHNFLPVLETFCVQILPISYPSASDDDADDSIFPTEPFSSMIDFRWQKGALLRVKLATGKASILDRVHMLLMPCGDEGLVAEFHLIEPGSQLKRTPTWSIGNFTDLADLAN